MNTNQYFSFPRVILVMKRDLMENWKTNLYRFLGPYAGILLVMILGYWNVPSYISFQGMVLSAFMAVLVIGGVYSASLIMEPMRTQHGRTSFLMLPATMLEKFVSRALFMTVGFFLMATLALVLAEATRYIFLPLFDVPESFHQSVLPYIWEQCTTVERLHYGGCSHAVARVYGWLSETAGVLSFCWTGSLFILGGCYWHKNPFWKTLGMMILAVTLIAVLLGYAVKWIGTADMTRFVEWVEIHFEWVTIGGMLCFFIVTLSLFILFNWWLSYKVFKRSQVIKPKFSLL